ncbi:hypothetical protein BG015_002909 [Linnemannia schmuckeri]|uniref:Uncharacterized protein n=1 Tax=Linnemannia schmuckeri TaxID=64567 RepID=A0A9P5RNI1_9FUNG|nr:hypothetical protein BG015_002909 [Linnemannia schmuckeri]
MAILTRDVRSNYAELHRIIQFASDDEMTVHLSWYSCPPFCHFCKTEGRIRETCPRLRRFLFCSNYRQNGHSATNCRTTLSDNNDPNSEEVEKVFNELSETNNSNTNNNNTNKATTTTTTNNNNKNKNNNNFDISNTNPVNEEDSSESAEETSKSGSIEETKNSADDEEEDDDSEDDPDYEPPEDSKDDEDHS